MRTLASTIVDRLPLATYIESHRCGHWIFTYMLTDESDFFKNSKRIIIITGTDPTVPKGGIGHAITAHIAALRLAHVFIPTYHPHHWTGKWLPFVKAIPVLIQSLKQANKNGCTPIVFSHIGKDGSVLREIIILLIARLYGAKTFAQLHSVIEEYFKSNLSACLFNMLLFQADQVGVLTRFWKLELVKRGIKKKIVVLPNPLSEELAQLAKSVLVQNKKKQGKTLVLSMARIEPGKGVELIIEAMQYLPQQVYLIVAGDGSMLSACKRKAQLLKVDDRIKFVGWVEKEKKKHLFNQADIFCLPTTYDSFGMGFIEAMANGLPVIALNWGPLPDVVPSNKAGILVNSADPIKFADAVMGLHENAPLRVQMGKFGAQWVLQQFSPEKLTSKFDDIFSSI